MKNFTRISLAFALFPALTVLAQDAAAPAASPELSVLVMRWLHILGAVALLGGGIFFRAVLLPSVGVLSNDEHDKLRAAVRGRWSKVVMITTLILLVTGFYNYITVGTVVHKGQGPYHMMMGIKIILAFAVFFLAALLAGKTGLAQKLQANGKLWVAVNVALGTIIVIIAGYLRYFPVVH